MCCLFYNLKRCQIFDVEENMMEKRKYKNDRYASIVLGMAIHPPPPPGGILAIMISL